MVQDHPHGAISYLNPETLGSSHGSILPRLEASDGPGAVHFDGRTRARNLRRIGEDGRFEFGPVPARRYRLLLRNADGIEQELADFAVGRGQRLELGELRPR